MAVPSYLQGAGGAGQAARNYIQNPPAAPSRDPSVTEADLAAGVPAGAKIVKRVPAPSGQGELLIDEQGGVYDTGGTSFSGSYFSLAPEQRQGTRKFTDIRVDPKTGGYTLVSDIPGQEYAFGPSEFVKNMPKANPLYSDPGFLAWAANYGMDYETAASDVARQSAAINNALGLRIPEIKQEGKKREEGIYGGFASRGLYGSSQQAGQEDESRAQTLSDVGKAEAAAAGQIEGLVSGLVKKRQAGLQEATAKGYDVGGQQYLSDVFGEVDKKYPLGGQTGLKY